MTFRPYPRPPLPPAVSRVWNIEARRRHPDVEGFLRDREGPVGDLARRLRKIVHDAVPDAEEGMKWGVPFFVRKGPLCYISPARRHVTFGLARGVEIDDTSGRLCGTGKSPIRKAEIRPGDLPEADVRGWLAQAVALDEAGE